MPALAPISPGEAVITGAHDLPNRYVIHTLGPIYRVDEPADELLADCYCNSLLLAERERISSLALPAISTGAFGYPFEPAAHVAARTVADLLTQLSELSLVRFVLYSRPDLRLFWEVLSQGLSGPASGRG